MLTPTQRCMYDVLADGRPHSVRELHGCLPDEQGDRTNVERHISNIRRHLRPCGEEILCVIHRRTVHYQRVRLLITATS